MKKDELLRRARNPKNIPGIFNYCDRWCERCAFTDRCLNYDPSNDRRRNPGADDMSKEEFWKKLQESFQTTMELLRDMAAEHGIDLDQAAAEAEPRERKPSRDDAREHPLARLAMDYIHRVDAWFKDHAPRFGDKGRELQSAADLELPGRAPAAEAAAIDDCVEIVRWYQHQIYVKLMRALGRDPVAFEGTADRPSDADGSVKVALLGADRSIAAWGRLRGHLPDEADSIVDLLVLLDRIRRQAEQQFPKARAFVRPGFDTGGA